MNYTHLTQEERYQIYTLLREGFSKRYIALKLNRFLINDVLRRDQVIHEPIIVSILQAIAEHPSDL